MVTFIFQMSCVDKKGTDKVLRDSDGSKITSSEIRFMILDLSLIRGKVRSLV